MAGKGGCEYLLTQVQNMLMRHEKNKFKKLHKQEGR